MSLTPYFKGFYGTPLAYLPILNLIFLPKLINGVPNKNITNIFPIMLIGFLLETISILHGDSLSVWIFNSTRYILFAIFGYLLAMNISPKDVTESFKLLTLFLFVLTFPLLIIGDYRFLIFENEIHKTYTLFGLNISELRGPFWNSNYLSIVSLILAAWFLSSKRYIFFALASMLVFMAGSRSGIGLLLLISVYHFFKRNKLILSIIVVSLFMTYIPETIIEIFSQRGFTGRDELVSIAMEILDDTNYFGVGHDFDKELIRRGAFTSTVQNTFLTNSLKYSIFGAFFIFLISSRTLYVLFKVENLLFYPFCVVYFDSFLRTYSIGGSGFISLVFTIIVFYGLFKSVNQKLFYDL